MKKGVLFSIDAALAIALVLGMFGTLLLLDHSSPEKGETGEILFLKASDDLISEFYSGGTASDNPTGTEINCQTINDYEDGGGISERLKQCRSFG